MQTTKRPQSRHSGVVRNPVRRASTHETRRSPVSHDPRRLVIPAKAGTYPRRPMRPRPKTRRMSPLDRFFVRF